MNRVILASKSPRRKDILSLYVKDLLIETIEVDEHILNEFKPEVNVMSLAFEKSKRISLLYPDDIIIGADTIVVLKNEFLGKPKSREDAKKMLKILSGETHYVYSGYSILHGDKKLLGYDVSEVTFKDLSDEYIENYLDTGEYLDKAGSYAIQGYGAVLVSTIRGHFENIVGLPISKISDDLKKYFRYDLLRGK